MNGLLIFLLSIGHLVTLAQIPSDSTFAVYQRSLDKRVPVKEAIRSAQVAVETSRDDSLSGLAQIQLGVLCWNDGQLDRALNHLKKGQDISRKLNHKIEEAKSIHYRGLTFYYQCDFDRALELYDSAELMYRNIKNDSAVAKIKSHKGIIHNVRGDYNLAIENMVESFRLQEHMPGYRDLTLPLYFPNAAARTLYYESKLNKDLESLRFLEGSNDREKQAITLFNIGKDYHYLNKFKEAIPFLKRSDQIYKSIGQIPFYNYAASYTEMGKYDSAEYWYKIRLNEVLTKGTQIHLAASYLDLAAFYNKQRKLTESLYYYELAGDLNRKMGLLRSVSTGSKAIAQILLAMGKPEAALKEIETCLQIARKISCLRDKQEFLEIKASILNRLNRNDEAFKVMSESAVLRDSIYNGESQLQTARLQIEYDTEKKSRDLAGLQTQNDLKEAELANKNLLLILGLFVIVMVVGSILFLYWRYTQKVRNAAELGIKNQLIGEKNILLTEQARQKEALLHEIHHRVKNNLQVISSLINLKAKQASTETNEALQQLGNRIFTMGLIHEKLYQREDIQTVRLDTYLAEVGDYLVASFSENEHPVRLDLNCDPIEIEVDKALACGLICNELFTNSMKHAFADDQQGREVSMELKKGEQAIEWRLGDNGTRHRALPDTFSQSFGLRFVEQLVNSKLEGSLVIEMKNGFSARINLPLRRNGKDQHRHNVPV